MDIVKLQYVQIDLIGIVLILIMLFYTIFGAQYFGRKEQRIFIRLLICNMVILICDITSYMINGYNQPYHVVTSHIACIIYFILHSYFGYLWMMYSIYTLYPEFIINNKQKTLILIPCFIAAFLVVTSPWTHMIYSLNENNIYARGEYLWIVVCIPYLYWLISAILIFKEIFKPSKIREASVYFTLVVFPIPTYIGNVIQIKNYGSTLIWVCSTISLLILFINLQNYQVSRDLLTELFNRRQASKQIRREMKQRLRYNYKLFGMIVDLDRFKFINDTYGHIIGDQALRETSNILRKSFRPKDFISRFGGDEFFILGHIKDENELKELISKMDQNTQCYNRQCKYDYTISFSIGYVIYNRDDECSGDDLIINADKNMYKVKRVKHIKEMIIS